MRRRSTMPSWVAIPVWLFARLLYRVRVLGASRVPAAGGAVVIANHLSYMDVVVLQLACPRPLRFVAFRGPGTGALLDWIFRTAGVIEVIARPAVASGSGTPLPPCGAASSSAFFPEGEISRTGQLMAIRRGLRAAGAPGEGARHPGRHRRALGLRLLLLRQPLPLEVAPPDADGRVRRVRRADSSRARQRRDRAPGAHGTGRAGVLRKGRSCAATSAARPYARWPGGPARAAVVDRSAGRREVGSARAHRRGRGPFPANQGHRPRGARRHRPSARGGRRDREPRGRLRGQGAREPQFHGLRAPPQSRASPNRACGRS